MRPKSYGQVVRDRMRNPPAGPALSLRELSRAVGYSYEHLRKIVNGLPVSSEAMNKALCRVLKLDEQEMWRLATREKVGRKYGREAVVELVQPPDSRLTDIWPKLTSGDRDQLLKLAETMLLANRSRRNRQ